MKPTQMRQAYNRKQGHRKWSECHDSKVCIKDEKTIISIRVLGIHLFIACITQRDLVPLNLNS